VPDSLTSFLSDLFSENDGVISFERFMQEALYHPDYGYYTANIRSVGGHRGDFTTSPELSQLPATAIASWILEEAANTPALKTEKPLHVIEIGGGDGSLAHGIFQSWPWLQRRRIRYHLVEVSPVLRGHQEEKLHRWRKQCRWHTDITAALKEANGCALVFSNELIDAFPAIAVRWSADNNQWEEIHLKFDPNTGMKEVFLPLTECRSRDLEQTYSVLKDEIDSRKNGDRREFHHSARSWIKSWIDLLQHGSILTIDYGNTVGSLYHRRPEGSLRAYYQHQRLNGAAIYQRFGRQDLTADVNFTDLENWGTEFDLETIRLESLKKFIGRYHPKKSGATQTTAFDSSDFVTDADGSGEAFKALLQRKP